VPLHALVQKGFRTVARLTKWCSPVGRYGEWIRGFDEARVHYWRHTCSSMFPRVDPTAARAYARREW